MDQSQRPRYVSRFEHLALHPRLHHRVGFPIHYLPPREPLPKRICYNTRSTKLLSQTTTSTEANNQPTTTSTEEAHNQHNHLYLRGIQTNTTPITSTEEGFTKARRVYNKWLQRPQTQSFFLFSFLFPQKQDPNRLG